MLSKLQNTVYKFLKRENIRSGVYRTPLFILYYHYTRYTRLAETKSVSPIEFGRRMTQYFEKGKSGRYAYYLTNFPPPEKRRRRRIKLWYDRKMTGMRNGKKEKR